MPGAASSSKRTVAVLGVRNLSGRADEAWIGGALATLLRAELAAGEKLLVTPVETVARVVLEQQLAEKSDYPVEALQKLRPALNADAVMVGSYVGEGDPAHRKLRVNL